MARVRRFGPLFYGTMAAACLVLLGTYATLEFRPRIASALRFRALVRRWHDPKLPLAAREKAADQLMQFSEEAVLTYAAALNDPDSRVRAMACRHLASLPISGEAISACIGALGKHPDPETHSAVVDALANMARASGSVDAPGSPRRRIAEAFRAAGRDGSPIVRLGMIEAMTAARIMIVDPGPWLEDPDRSVRRAAAVAISQVDSANRRRIVPILRAMMLDMDPAQDDELSSLHWLLHETDRSACRKFLEGPGVPPRLRVRFRKLLREHVKGSPTLSKRAPY